MIGMGGREEGARGCLARKRGNEKNNAEIEIAKQARERRRGRLGLGNR